MDEAGNLKPIGGDPMKSLGKLTPEGKIPFDATQRAVPIVKKEISKADKFLTDYFTDRNKRLNKFHED